MVGEPDRPLRDGRLDAEGLAPQPPAEPRPLIRRLSLDLIGLPPAPEEVDAFVADRRRKPTSRWSSGCSLHRYHGERMAMDWLDAARYADTNGFQNDFARTMWPWRDWVIAAFNRNLPFDRFLIEQLAGDLLPGATLEQRIATGFNRNNRTVTEAGSIDEEYRIENAVDRLETTATVFLGLTLGCARCHDHKFDPVSQTEFYQFLGFFNNVNEQGVYTETRGNVPPLITLPTEQDRTRMAGFEIVFAAAKASGDKDWIAKVKKAKTHMRTAITSVMVMEDAPSRAIFMSSSAGRYDMPDTARKLLPGVPSCLPALPPARRETGWGWPGGWRRPNIR